MFYKCSNYLDYLQIKIKVFLFLFDIYLIMKDIKNNIKKILAIGSMVSVFGILFLLMFFEVPTNNREIFNTTFSMIIGGSIVLAFTYYFGDSDKVNNDEEN